LVSDLPGPDPRCGDFAGQDMRVEIVRPRKPAIGGVGCGRLNDAGIATIGKYARPNSNRGFTRPHNLNCARAGRSPLDRADASGSHGAPTRLIEISTVSCIRDSDPERPGV
jgi:hypothetical protein